MPRDLGQSRAGEERDAGILSGGRDAADSQPFIAPGGRTVLGNPPDSHAWHAWPLP